MAAGKQTFTQAGCVSCHTFTPAGSSGMIGPDLDSLPTAASQAGQPLPDFVHQSIVDPNAYIAPGYQPNVMPQNFGQTLSKKQIDELVAFLTQK